MGSQTVGILEGKHFLARFAVKKSYYRKNCSSVDFMFTSRITFRFEVKN